MIQINKNMNNTKVRIIMPVYNGEKFIGAAIESVIAQTYENWELVIVDDGSTDSTPEIIKKYMNSRISCITQKRGGPENARQKGYKGCRTEYTARMDADDQMDPERLSLQVEYLEERPEMVAVGGQIMFLSEDGRQQGFPSAWPQKHETIIEDLCNLRGSFCNATVMSRRSVHEKIEKIKNGGPGADVEFILKLSEFGKIANLDQIIHYVRIHNSSIQSSFDPYERRIRSRYAIYCWEKTRAEDSICSYDEYREKNLQLPFNKMLIERREILLGRLVRQAVWAKLNNKSLPRIAIIGLTAFVVSPIRSLKKLLLWTRYYSSYKP